MEANAGPVATAAGRRHCHVDRPNSRLQHLPQLGGAPMTESRAFPARQDCRHPSSLVAQPGVPDRIHTAKDPVQSSRIDPASDRVPVEARGVQLADGDDSVLPRCDPGH